MLNEIFNRKFQGNNRMYNGMFNKMMGFNGNFYGKGGNVEKGDEPRQWQGEKGGGE